MAMCCQYRRISDRSNQNDSKMSYSSLSLCFRYGRTRPDSINTEREALDDMTQLLETGLMSDVTLEVDGQQIAAHKAILAQRCQYFRAMFTVDMAEARKNTITIEGFSYMTMNLLVKFLYSGMVHYPSCDQLQNQYPQLGCGKPEDELYVALKLAFLADLLAAADYFTLSSLTNLCSQMLYDLIDCFSSQGLSSYLHVLELSKQHWLPFVKEHCIYRMDSIMLLMLQDEDESRLAQVAEVLDEACAHNNIDPLLWGATKELYQVIDGYYSRCCGELSMEMVKDLIAKGADVNRARTLHHLCSLPSGAAKYQEKVATAKEIIHGLGSMGYDVNLKDASSCTPLYRATMYECAPLVQVLLDLGADTSIVSNAGLAPWEMIQKKEAEDDEGRSRISAVQQLLVAHHQTFAEHSTKQSKEDGHLTGEGSDGEAVWTPDQPSCSQREAGPCGGQLSSEELGGGHKIISEFLEQFMSGDSINDRANVSYELTPNGYVGWDFEQKLFNFCYPRLNSQLLRFTGQTSRAQKTGNLSVQEVGGEYRIRSYLRVVGGC